jgi:hypothetical protein
LPDRRARHQEATVEKLRAQSGRVIAARGSWTVCSLLLASALLAGCHNTSTTSTTGSAAAQAATNAAATVSTSSTTTSTTTSTTSTASTASTPAPTAKSADVSWTAPTTNTNGSALTDLAGYQIYYGTSPDALNQIVNVTNAGATDYVVQGLSPGTWYFAVAAYTNAGLQSSLSSVVSKTIS